jgi:hypothetical protein
MKEFGKYGKRRKSAKPPLIVRFSATNKRSEVKGKARPIFAFNNRFAAALGHFGAALLETSGIGHTVIKGTKREDTFRDFLAQRLPKRYGVASGEVVDQLNTVSPQLDALIFDQTRNFSFSDGEVHVLPAEALLVSIEVKSKLDAGEVKKCCDAARRLRALQPFKLALGGKDVGRAPSQTNKHARYLHCVFAYDTDLVEPTWLQSEAQRFAQNGCNKEHLIDAVYVLKRGLLNLNDNRGRLEDENGSAITSFYFSILNFVQREGGRRSETPYQEYASLLGGKWIHLA